MKKTATILLAIVAISMLFVSCLSTTAADHTMVVLTKPAKDQITDAKALSGMQTSRACFNSTAWLNGYSVADIMDEILWYTPADDQVCTTGSIGDPYTDTAVYNDPTGKNDVTMRNKLLSFPFMEDAYNTEYDSYFGLGQKVSYEVYYKVFTFLGNEALLYVPAADGVYLSDILVYGPNEMKDIMFVNALAFDFTFVDGTVKTFTKEEIGDDSMIVLSDDLKSANVLIGDAVYEGLYSITPAGFTKDSTPIEGRINRYVLPLASKVVREGAETKLGNIKGTYYNAVTVKDVLAKYGVLVSGEKAGLAASDGAFTEMDAEQLANRYLIAHASNGVMAIEPLALKDNGDADALKNTTALKFDNASIVLINAEKNFADLAKKVGMTGNFFDVVFADNHVERIDAKTADQLVFTVDTDIVAVKAYN